MKKIYMTMVALLCGVAAMAQIEATIDVEPVEVAQGEKVYIPLGLTSSESLCAVSFRIAFPEGTAFGTRVEMVYDEDLDEDVETEVYDFEIDAARSQGHVGEVKELGTATPEDVADKEAGFLMFAVTSNPVKNFKKKVGTFATISIAASPQAVVGENYVITIKKAAASTSAGVSVPLADMTIPVKITQGTGINSVNADDVNAPVYNLAGQRVSKAQKGIFIQNGKKTIK